MNRALVMHVSHINEVSNSPTLGLTNVGGFKVTAQNIASLYPGILRIKNISSK